MIFFQSCKSNSYRWITSHGYYRINLSSLPAVFSEKIKTFFAACAIGMWSRVRFDCARALNHGMITWRAMRAPRRILAW